MIKLCECYALPFPEWIVNKQFGELWDNIPHHHVRAWFEIDDICFALCAHLEKIPFVADSSFVIEPNDYSVKKFGVPLNSVVLYIANFPRDWEQVVNEAMKNFPIGIYCGSIESLRPQIVTCINYNGQEMVSYELADGTIQPMGCDQHGYYYKY